MDLLTVVIVLAYLLATAYLGYVGYRQSKTATDYLVAGRKAHPVVMALSYGATFISTSAIVGFGGQAANMGMGLLWLTFMNIFVGIFVAFVVLGGPTRRMGHHLDAHTFPELVGRRYDSKLIQVLMGLIIFVFMPLYAMAVIVGGAQFIATAFNITSETALYIFALLVAAYVIAGGLKGVMLTDALQGAIMLVGMLALLLGTYVTLGGVTPAHESLTSLADKVPAGLKAMGHQGWTSMPKFGWAATAMAADPTLRKPDQFDLWWIMVSTIVMGVGVGVLAQPQLIVRFMTVKSKQALNRGVMIGGAFILCMTGVAFTVGALSNAYFAKNEAVVCEIQDKEALLDPGPKGDAVLKPVLPEASDEVKKRAKKFVAYRLPGEPESQPLRYILRTPGMKFEKTADGKCDVIRPGLISIARSIDAGTTMKGDVDKIIPKFVDSAFPRWFGVVFLLTLLAAAMSTLSSQFHTMGTAIGRDVVERLTRSEPGRSITITRLGIVVGLIVAVVLGKIVGDNIIALATAIFFGLCAAAFLPAFVGGLFWRRMTRTGAIASIVTGFLVSTLWLLFINGKTAGGVGICNALFHRPNLVPAGWSVTWTVVDPLFVALPISVLVAISVSLLTRPMDKAYVDYCFGGPKPEAR